MPFRFSLLLSLAFTAAASHGLAQQTSAIPEGCVPALTAAEYQRLSPQEQRKYREVGLGANRGKYRPRYFELVGGAGPCSGFYANPCGHDRFSTELVDANSCGFLQSIARSRKLKPVKPTEASAESALAPKNRKKLERIADGSDAGKFKPKYYERTKEGLWASPCGHDGRSTELVESNACTEIQSLVRVAR